MCTYNDRHYNDFSHAPDFCNFIFQPLVFFYLLKFLIVHPIFTRDGNNNYDNLFFLLINKYNVWFLALIYRSYWNVISLKVSLSTAPSVFCLYQLLALSNSHLLQTCQWIYRSTLSCFPIYFDCPSLPYSLVTLHGPPFLPSFHTFCTKGILLYDQYKISYNLFWALHIRATVHPFKSPLAIHCLVLSLSISSFSLAYGAYILFCFHAFFRLLCFAHFVLLWIHSFWDFYYIAISNFSWVMPLYYFSHTNSSSSPLSSLSLHNWSDLFLSSFWARIFWQHHFLGEAPYSFSWFF